MRGAAHGAEERVGGVGGPTAQDDAVDAEGGDGQDVEDRHREVGQLQRRGVAEDAHLRPEGG